MTASQARTSGAWTDAPAVGPVERRQVDVRRDGLLHHVPRHVARPDLVAVADAVAHRLVDEARTVASVDDGLLPAVHPRACARARRARHPASASRRSSRRPSRPRPSPSEASARSRRTGRPGPPRLCSRRRPGTRRRRPPWLDRDRCSGSGRCTLRSRRWRRAREADRERLPVPALRVRLAVRRRGDGRRGRVVLEADARSERSYCRRRRCTSRRGRRTAPSPPPRSGWCSKRCRSRVRGRERDRQRDGCTSRWSRARERAFAPLTSGRVVSIFTVTESGVTYVPHAVGASTTYSWTCRLQP